MKKINLETLDDKLEYYLSLPYTIEVTRDGDEEEYWFAKVVELPGCMTEADSFIELGEMIEDAMRVWLEIALEDGKTIPEPRSIEEYSGKFVVRIPKSLHQELVKAAEREGVSLNAFANFALTRSVGLSLSSMPTTKSEENTPAL